jgi:gliding motility-associated-like protein
VTDYYLQIYNRWGELVFVSENPAEGWNGRVWNSEQELPAAQYFYLLKYRFICESDTLESHGIVEMIR